MNCPKCGAPGNLGGITKCVHYDCGALLTKGGNFVDVDGSCRIGVLEKERDALAARVAELEDEALAEDPLQDELESARAEIERQLEKIGELVERVEQLESFEQICKDPATLWLQWTRGNVSLPEGIGDVRELQERVKRLEEAGNKMAWCFLHPFDNYDGDPVDNWAKAKETKP